MPTPLQSILLSLLENKVLFSSSGFRLGSSVVALELSNVLSLRKGLHLSMAILCERCTMSVTERAPRGGLQNIK